MTPSLSQQEAQRLWSTHAFLIVQGLPPLSQILIDACPTAFIINDKFQGIKLLPKGWHCLAWSIAAEKPHSQVSQPQFGVKNVLLKWFDLEQVVVRSLDLHTEELTLPSSSSGPCSIVYKKNRTISTHNGETVTIASKDYLKTLDPQLLPYPVEVHRKWTKATRWLHLDDGNVGKTVVTRVLGVDPETGDAAVDGMMTGPCNFHDDQEKTKLEPNDHGGRLENGKIVWGKSRSQHDQNTERFQVLTQDDEGEPIASDTLKRKQQDDQQEATDGGDDGMIRFTQFNLKRSWPPGSVGQALTKYSLDKSWLLRDVMDRANPSFKQVPHHIGLFTEFELAFIVFIMCHNAYCLDYWKAVICLFCRSSSYIGASMGHEPHPSTPTDTSESTSSTTAMLDSHSEFVSILSAQMDLLENEFWSSQQHQGEEKWLLGELESLRVNIGRALSARAAAQPDNRHDTDRQAEQLIGAWRSLSYLVKTKFGWDLDKRLDEEAEVQDDLEADQGDEAPIVVEL